MINFVINAIELQNWGLNAPTLIFIIIIGLTILQAYGLNRQSRKIRQYKKATAVSLPLFTYLSSLFTSLFIYGIYKDSLILCCQGLLAMPCGCIAFAIWIHKKMSNWNWLCFFIPLVMLLAVLTTRDKDSLMLTLLIGGLVALTIQFIETISKKDRGQIQPLFIFTFLLPYIFIAFLYGIVTENWIIELIILFFYFLKIWLYLKYQPKKFSQKDLTNLTDLET